MRLLISSFLHGNRAFQPYSIYPEQLPRPFSVEVDDFRSELRNLRWRVGDNPFLSKFVGIVDGLPECGVEYCLTRPEADALVRYGRAAMGWLVDKSVSVLDAEEQMKKLNTFEEIINYRKRSHILPYPFERTVLEILQPPPRSRAVIVTDRRDTADNKEPSETLDVTEQLASTHIGPLLNSLFELKLETTDHQVKESIDRFMAGITGYIERKIQNNQIDFGKYGLIKRSKYIEGLTAIITSALESPKRVDAAKLEKNLERAEDLLIVNRSGLGIWDSLESVFTPAKFTSVLKD